MKFVTRLLSKNRLCTGVLLGTLILPEDSGMFEQTSNHEILFFWMNLGWFLFWFGIPGGTSIVGTITFSPGFLT